MQRVVFSILRTTNWAQASLSLPVMSGCPFGTPEMFGQLRRRKSRSGSGRLSSFSHSDATCSMAWGMGAAGTSSCGSRESLGGMVFSSFSPSAFSLILRRTFFSDGLIACTRTGVRDPDILTY